MDASNTMAMSLTSDNIHLSEPTNSPAPEKFAVDCNRSTGRIQEKIAVNCNPSIAINCTDPEVLRFIEAATAANTRRAYESDLRHFLAWGGAVPATPQTVACYLANHASVLAIATLARHIIAIRRVHIAQGHSDPTRSELVRRTFQGIRRLCRRPQRRAAAITPADLAAICSLLGDNPKDVRDRAVLLVGFGGAFRRSELCAIDRGDVDIGASGMTITIRRSKTDQEGQGRKVAIPRGRGSLCPVAALERWLAVSGITEGAVFRPVTRAGRVGPGRISPEAIATIVKQRIRAIGRDPSSYSGHSLRAGFVTAAALAGLPLWKIKMQTGHASDAMLGRYIRDGGLFGEAASDTIL